MQIPQIIQAGMGLYVSTPNLANLCARLGVLGTVSGTAAERMLPRILELGDPGGDCRRALEHFPFPEISEKIIKRFFIEGGKSPNQDFKVVPAFSMQSRRDLIELTVAGSFVFVWLAKEGHDKPISVNYLEKIQIPHIYHLTGAMLAGVDFVTMGAGITFQIPGVLDAIASGGSPSYRVFVEGSKDRTKTISFDPHSFFGDRFPKELRRPGFIPIVSTDILASLMMNKLPLGSVQAFSVELNTAGGHNASPRDKGNFDETGQPIYGPRDEVNFGKLRDLGVPFFIAGGYASPRALAEAKELEASGIQAGTIFALSDDSGINSIKRREMRKLGYRGELVIRTDPTASPTGFPFKVVQLSGTHSDSSVYEARERKCSVKALLVPYEQPDGKVGFRCCSEPVKDYLRKGGKLEDTIGARCLCNGLAAGADLGGLDEWEIFTLGDDLSFLPHLMKDENDSYTANDSVNYLLS